MQKIILIIIGIAIVVACIITHNNLEKKEEKAWKANKEVKKHITSFQTLVATIMWVTIVALILLISNGFPFSTTPTPYKPDPCNPEPGQAEAWYCDPGFN